MPPRYAAFLPELPPAALPAPEAASGIPFAPAVHDQTSEPAARARRSPPERPATHLAPAWAAAQDDVDQATKMRRLNEVIAAFRAGQATRNQAEIGCLHLVRLPGCCCCVCCNQEPEWPGPLHFSRQPLPDSHDLPRFTTLNSKMGTQGALPGAGAH